MKESHKINLEKNQFETPKRYTGKSSNKTQDNETIITQERYDVFIDPDESDANGRTNANDELSNNVTASASSQVNLRNNDVKKDQHKHKSKTKKEMKMIVIP